MEVIVTHLGKTIKRARQSARLTQDELSERVGVSTRYIMGLENEKKLPSFKVFCKLVQALDISVESIFYPARTCTENEAAELHRLLLQCDSRDITVLTDTARSLLKNK